MKITAIKGMNDILPGEVELWQFLEQTAQQLFGRYGYREIRVPVVEKTELFTRSIGEATDIVEKEMYTFEDQGGHRLTLRPEGTASVMRALLQHRLYQQDPLLKLYYKGPMFRHERPQKGRYRQFHQIGVEAVGSAAPLLDAQILIMLWDFGQAIGLPEVELQLNSLGCDQCRPDYRQALIHYLQQHQQQLCPDCQRRLHSNPMRTLDCKVPGCQPILAQAPIMLDHLCGTCEEHFQAVRTALDDVQAPYSLNPRMVRGLDYYTKTAFELVTDRLGAQSAVAAGGRYDKLTHDLGGPDLPGIGFAMGMERLILLLQQATTPAPQPRLFIAAMGPSPRRLAFKLLHQTQSQGYYADMEPENKSLKAQMRRADRLGAHYVLILGEDELQQDQAQLRHMASGEQQQVAISGMPQNLWPVLDATG